LNISNNFYKKPDDVFWKTTLAKRAMLGIYPKEKLGAPF